ncbi:FIST C-terminal domain-containing protein [Azonexus sp.]|uniref:FIST C-terminal domain-containing protein n=1 Tax=Azonexus sp. TaxID=1872668 RepID=UPI0035B3DC6E
MIVASGQAKAFVAAPELAAEAIAQALARAGLQRAEFVLLLLTHDFSRLLPETLRCAASAAACLQISGCTASGLFTEEGWQIDQPAAAALVFSGLSKPPTTTREPLLSLSNQGWLAMDWQYGRRRVGLIESQGEAWNNARPCTDTRCTVALPDLPAIPLLARGLLPLGETLTVSAASGHELREIDGRAASDSLRQALSEEWQAPALLHRLQLLTADDAPATGILACNADGSLTTAAPIATGATVRWAIRQAPAAGQEIRKQLREARTAARNPAFGLMFSCLGRGPLFYGNDDLDRRAFTENFPGLPLLGAYGTGQIFPLADGNRLFSNAVLTLLYENDDVQSQP